MEISTKRLTPSEEGLEKAAAVLRAGGRVAFPTETVYGLGADARDDAAVASIFAAKDRPQFNPLIVHVSGIGAVARHAVVTDAAERLADAFWPGALTLVLPRAVDSPVSRLVTAGLDSIAVRVPASTVAQDLLNRFGGPIAAPSANRSGRISPTTAAHVAAGLDGQIEAILDGGPCPVGVESTIVDLTGPPRLLRFGGVPLEALEHALGRKLAPPPSASGARPNAPGQLVSHYAPRAEMRLNASGPQENEVFLGFGPVGEATLNLSVSGNLAEAAANLFDCLHRLDNSGVHRIAVAPVPDIGLGSAINDRLKRAAAPRG